MYVKKERVSQCRNDYLDATDEEEESPDVEDLKSSEICPDNHTSCISDKIDAVLEVLDEETVFGLLLGYRKVLHDDVESNATHCTLQGCEFDYSSNTYRLMVILKSPTSVIAEHFLIVKIDSATGYPKVLSVR